MDALKQALHLLFSLDPELLQILGVTMRMSFFSTTLSCLVGLPLGALIGTRSFRGKAFLKKLIHTLMGLPPVVAGLLVYALFTVRVMVVAQCLLIIPVVTGLTASFMEQSTRAVIETAKGMGLSRRRVLFLCLSEGRTSLLSVVLNAFGRSIAEVGAVSIVGGNIQWKTRVMTTAIMLETNKGNFSFALALGMILLLIAFVVNVAASFVVREVRDD